MNLLFVYGTLRPGEVRWHHLEPWVVDDGRSATAAGELYDTGLDYPAAVFRGSAVIRGRVYELSADLLDPALEHLDDVEGAVRGLYRRVRVATSEGEAWAYECGDEGLLRTRIESGDWQQRQNGL